MSLHTNNHAKNMVPLFLDSDYIDDKIEHVRFIYWKLDIKQIDFDDLCSCNGGGNGSTIFKHEFNKIKLHVIYNQLIIIGIKGNNNYEFLQKDDFTRLFDIAYSYKPYDYRINYVTIDQDYILVPKDYIKKSGKESNWYTRGSIFRVHEDQFIDLVYDKEKMAFDSFPTSLEFSEKETNAYLGFIENLIDEI